MAWHWGNGMGWWMLFGGILWVAFWVSLIYLGVWLVRGGRGGAREGDEANREDPMQILKRRYAQGEISREEFERIREGLGGTAPGHTGTNGAAGGEEVKRREDAAA